MVAGKVPAPKLIDDAELFAIRDINPRAPVHILVIPKKHIPTASDISEEDGPLLARMTRAAAKLAAEYPSRVSMRCGLLTHALYENDSFIERMRSAGPLLIAPAGTGIGFDDLIERLPWERLR